MTGRHMKTTMLRAALIGGTLIAPPAAAQVAPAGGAQPGPGEIVVTAQKRAQNIQDIGISVTALNQNALSLLQKSDITQLAKAVPSLQVQQFSPTLTIFNIRGVSQNDFGDFQEAPIAFYNDEVYIASLGAIAGQTFDLERVEVLRGPQGTLFGRNATGGLVQIVTAKPTKTLQGFATLTFGSYGEIASEAAISGPLSDRVRARLSFTSDHFGGYIRNLTGPDQGNKRFYAGRAQIEADVGDRGLLSLKAEVLRDDHERPTGYKHIPTGDDADCRGTFAPSDGFGAQALACYPFTLPFVPNLGYVPVSNNPFIQSYNKNSFFARTYYNLEARYQHDLGFATLTSITDYQHLHKVYEEDDDASPFSTLDIGTRQRFYQVSQELRLNGRADRLTWTLGAFGLKLHSVNPQHVNLPPIGYFAQPDARANTTSVAVFGQGEYKLSDVFTAIVGGRYSWDWKHFDLAVRTQQLDFATFQPFEFDYFLNHALQPDLAHRTYRNYSGKAELDAKLDRDTLLYVSLNRGTKSGGFNVPYVIQAAAPPAPDSLVYGQEVLTSLEGGFKLSLLNRKLTVDASAFHYWYHNYQAFSYTNGNSSITNQPARITGFEVELTARPLPRLELNASVSHLAQAEVRDVRLPPSPANPLGRVTDTRLPQAPRWSVGGGLTYTAPVTDTVDLKLATNWKYDTAQYFTTLNAPVDREAPHLVGDVRASATLNRKLELALSVNNITNKFYRIYDADNSFVGVAQGTYARPRWFAGSITYRFGG